MVRRHRFMALLAGATLLGSGLAVEQTGTGTGGFDQASRA